jgi:hypothetical protein
MMNWLRELSRQRKSWLLKEWFRVCCSDDGVELDVIPPQGEAWRASIRWSEIQKVCIRAEDLELTEIHLLDPTGRYVIPVHASGACELWDELRRRKIIGREFVTLAIAVEKGIHCWTLDATI